MKKAVSLIAILSFVASTLLLTGCDDSYPSELSVYPFKTLIVQYELSGGTEGDQSLFIRGDQQALQTFITTPGQESNTLELSLGSEKYIADLDKMTAVKATDSHYAHLLELSGEEQEAYMIKKNLGLKESVVLPKPVTTSMVAGQVCDVYEIPNVGTACMWNGIVLQEEMTLAGITSKTVAVNVQVDVDIPAERFELPAGVIVK